MPIDPSKMKTPPHPGGPVGPYHLEPRPMIPDARRAKMFVSPDMSISTYDDDFVAMDAKIRGKLATNSGGREILGDQNARWAAIFRELPQKRLENALALLKIAERKIADADRLTDPERQGGNPTTLDPERYKRMVWLGTLHEKTWPWRAAYYWKHRKCPWGISVKDGFPDGLPILTDAEANKLFAMRARASAIPAGDVAATREETPTPAPVSSSGNFRAALEEKAAHVRPLSGELPSAYRSRLVKAIQTLNTKHGLSGSMALNPAAVDHLVTHYFGRGPTPPKNAA